MSDQLLPWCRPVDKDGGEYCRYHRRDAALCRDEMAEAAGVRPPDVGLIPHTCPYCGGLHFARPFPDTGQNPRPALEPLTGRGEMYADLYARLADRWGQVLDAADKGEDATVLEVVNALRNQGEDRGHRPPRPPKPPKDREWDGS